ncbi:transcriptional regulator [Candidatus Scalindua japonica]|uniref:Transcriptional regulator n=1 Tax=Candidatus Scalindua japonica TaxID=1284222 RepID=A0A286U2B1_9BACT|nr:transcriptional regulator [Candidatus Scalindua japonica]
MRVANGYPKVFFVYIPLKANLLAGVYTTKYRQLKESYDMSGPYIIKKRAE